MLSARSAGRPDREAQPPGFRRGVSLAAETRLISESGQARHIGRDVEEVPGLSEEMFFQFLAIPHAR